jgi:DNA/RNA-binding protein KIN17
MCNKKCGDKNGFKLHCDSESHQRQLLLFAENQDAYLREFSNAFENDFLKVFKELFDGKRTRANDVYQEYIRHNNHIHMNATVWHTLGEFVEYLGQTKKCQIDQDETFGWHIQLIDKERELRIQKMAERLQNEKTDEEREILILQQRIERYRNSFYKI